MAGTIGGFWSVPPRLYAEPARLAWVGFLTEEREGGGRRRRTYANSAEGRSALDEWLDNPADDGTELRDPALLKLYWAPEPAQDRGPGGRPRRRGPPPEPFRVRGPHRAPPRRTDLHQLSILALAARYETEAIAFWEAVAVDPDLT